MVFVVNKRIELMKRSESSRKLIVVDIENAVGSGVVTAKSCKMVMDRIARTHKPQDGDLIVLGVSHPRNFVAVKEWDMSARVVAKWGHDGADLALEGVLENENVENRFTDVVVVSGDGLFANQVRRLRSLGLGVTVDARITQLSRTLAFSCTSVKLAPVAVAA